MRLLWRASGPASGGLLLAVLAGAGAAGAAVGLMAVSAWLISRAALHPPVLHLMVAIVAVRALGLSRGALRYLERLAGHDAALRVLGRLRARIFTRLEVLAPAGLANFRRADLAQRLATDVDAVLDMLTRVILPYAVALLVGLGSVLLIGAFSLPAAAALGAGLLLVGVIVPLLQGRAARRADGRLAPLRGELATGTVTLLHGLPDLVAHAATDAHLDRLAATSAALRKAEQRSAAMAGVSAAVTALASGLSLIVGLAAGAVAVRSGSLSGEMLAVIVLTPLAVFENAAGLPVAAQRFASARASLRRLAEILSAPDPLAAAPALPRPRDGEPEGGELAAVAERGGALRSATSGAGVPAIRMDGVGARWVAGRPVLRDVDLVLRPGERVALVGPSGCGKSTLAALLVRFLDPVAGRITMEGTDLREIAPDRVRKVIGYLPEDAHLFDTTIAANLRVGQPDAPTSALRAVLVKARLADWVDSLPDGLETLVGEHGMALSGGQRRRLALARALLADFRVLILDEPTEHLDDETAAALTRDLLDAAGDRTVLLITHRTDLPDNLDQIVHLDSGTATTVRNTVPAAVGGRAGHS
ncbi:thiol reductant ABC exporter subunit CydC [Actinoplanes sp. NPDC051851]|uniref:thiol reductant ABC exporter subunit CydC n=1 Tax=Actinoplanes sp. NPDC051851 TaxID=3154753 RepID=UPI003423FDF5